MYLKNIEVHGFKSFAQKINFEFHNGITGIVGPNGSGKSNVGDAVRWVLGEQSAKQLRGGNMQDVIFSGTETRKPLSFASVAITLDNSDHKLPVDFNEVTVTRRLYRSGESEYLINGSACRLKDINEMFYDTGIGKEGYSIIGQGQIDKILSGKPEERRELFDEAAGIVKFKRRKATTIKKLQDEQANLVRVTDILSELTRQLGPLERQSETARIYLAKRDTLRELDVNSFLLENEETSRELKELDTKNTRAAEELETRGISAAVLKLNQIAPLDAAAILPLLEQCPYLLAAEDVCAAGCVGTRVLAACAQAGIHLRGARLLNAGDGIVLQGSVEEQERRLGLDAAGIARAAEALMKGGAAHEKTTA